MKNSAPARNPNVPAYTENSKKRTHWGVVSSFGDSSWWCNFYMKLLWWLIITGNCHAVRRVSSTQRSEKIPFLQMNYQLGSCSIFRSDWVWKSGYPICFQASLTAHACTRIRILIHSWYFHFEIVKQFYQETVSVPFWPVETREITCGF